MAFSYYQTAVNISDSAGSIIYTATASSSEYSFSESACATSARYGQTAGAFFQGATSLTSISGKSWTYSEAYNELGGSTYGISHSSGIKVSNATTATSQFPFKTFVHTISTFGSSTTTNNVNSTSFLSESSTISSTQSGTGDYISNSVIYEYESFTFTSTYDLQTSTTTSNQTVVWFGSESLSTSYAKIDKISGGNLSGTFKSTRENNLLMFFSPVNISRSYNLEYFRPVEPNSLILYSTPLIKVFTATESQALISDYDFLLNATISSSFSTAGLAQGVGSSVNTQPTTTVTLTTNGVSQVPQSSELVLYTYYPIEYGGKSFSFLSSSYTYQYDYDSFSETSSTYTYSIFANITTFPYGASYVSSAYSRYQTILVETTTTYPDISCNSITFLVYTKSVTINTTSSLLLATNIYLNSHSTRTEYAYSSYQEAFLSAGIRRPFNSYSFSSQKFLHGNFIKNISDETAYWSINLNTFGGIFDFSCQKIQGSDPYYTPVPKLFRFPNCYVTAPLDPISTTVLNVSINQSVSTNSLGTSISQTVYYESTSTTRTFDVHYEESVGTVASAVDTINNFDPVSNYGTSTLSPIAQIYFNAIFNTLGQLGQASYVADGAPFKQNSSEVSFASTTYTNPISVELYGNGYFYEQNSYSMFTVFTSDFGSPIVSETKSLQNFEIDPSA